MTLPTNIQHCWTGDATRRGYRGGTKVAMHRWTANTTVLTNVAWAVTTWEYTHWNTRTRRRCHFQRHNQSSFLGVAKTRWNMVDQSSKYYVQTTLRFAARRCLGYRYLWQLHTCGKHWHWQKITNYALPLKPHTNNDTTFLAAIQLGQNGII